MKNGLLIAGILMIFAACNKNSNSLAPVNNPSPYLNYYPGTYFGEYRESRNGVDSNGVFKNDTSYNMMLKLTDGGNYAFTINKGPLIISSIPVDSSGHFVYIDSANHHNITGYFINDSLYLFSNSLHGAYDSVTFVGSWFLIVRLSFKGKKEL